MLRDYTVRLKILIDGKFMKSYKETFYKLNMMKAFDQQIIIFKCLLFLYIIYLKFN